MSDFVVPLLKKFFNDFLLENPTFPKHPCYSSVHPIIPLISDQIKLLTIPPMYPPLSHLRVSLLPFSLPRTLFLHLCLWKLYPFLKTQLRCLLRLHENFSNHLKWKESAFLPELPHDLLVWLWVIFYTLPSITVICADIFVLLLYCNLLMQELS